MIKVAVIGAGSVLFTRQLMRDILTIPDLQDTIFSFTDIKEDNLDMVAELTRRDIRVTPTFAVTPPDRDGSLWISVGLTLTGSGSKVTPSR